MLNGPGFEEFLRSKMIDSDAFRREEPGVWDAWKREFEQMHPTSFTMQKLNLVNVMRRKYLLRVKDEPKPGDAATPTASPPEPAKPAKPVIKPRTN